MAKKPDKSTEEKAEAKTKQIEIRLGPHAFKAFFRRFGVGDGEMNFNDISNLRQLLSNEKARILHTLKHQKPNSIYELTKMLDRDFKSVRKDIELLRHFGFVRFISESKGRRKMLRPVLNLNKLQISIYL